MAIFLERDQREEGKRRMKRKEEKKVGRKGKEKNRKKERASLKENKQTNKHESLGSGSSFWKKKLAMTRLALKLGTVFVTV